MVHWIRVIHNGKYQYVLVDKANRPVQFNKNTGYFTAYSQPSTKSQRFNVYLSPDQPVKPTKQNNVYGTESNPLNLSEVTITPTKYIGIQRTPDDHTAALMRDQAVDAKVNPANDQLQNFFANLMTGGMYSSVSEGADNISKGNYVKGAAQMATPVMFGPAESTVANLTRLGVGAYDLLSKNGVQKTYNLAKQGNWTGAAQSAAGDALNLGMTLGGSYNLGKYNIPSFIQQAARNGNNTARSFKIPNLAYSTSLNTSTNRPYYLQFGNNSGNMMIQDIKNGRNEFINWMNNPKYREAAEQNRQEAISMGLSYTPTYEKPQYSWMLKYGIKPEFKSKMEGEGATSWMGAQEGIPTSVEYNLSSKIPYDKVTRHEVGHVSLHGNGKNAKELKYLRYKTHQVFKDDANVGPYDFHQQTGEAAMNGRDLGADLGISIGQEYPGYQKALDIINSNYKNSNKAGMVDVLKLDKESMPYVWKLLNGTLLGGIAFTTYNLNNNGKNK